MWAQKPISKKWIGADNLDEETTLAREHSLLKRTHNNKQQFNFAEPGS